MQITNLHKRFGKLMIWLREMINTAHIEFAELASLSYAVSWFVPLVFRPHFLSSSASLIFLEKHIPEHVCIFVVASLFLIHLLSLVCCITALSPMERHHWMRVRQSGLFCAMFCWFVLGMLFLQTGLSPACTQYPLLGLGCAWGVWRFSLMIKVDKELHSLRSIRRDVEAMLPV